MLAKKMMVPTQDEQITTLLLRKILAELRRLNANLEKRNAIVPVPPIMGEGDLTKIQKNWSIFE